jgi:hypothetical protein
VPKKLVRLLLGIITLSIIGIVIYFPVTALNAKDTTESTEALRTAVARAGNLVISASGTGQYCRITNIYASPYSNVNLISDSGCLYVSDRDLAILFSRHWLLQFSLC